MLNKDKLLHALEPGYNLVDDLVKRTGLTPRQVVSSASNLQQLDDLPIRREQRVLKWDYVILGDGNPPVDAVTKLTTHTQELVEVLEFLGHCDLPQVIHAKKALEKYRDG